jgi:hypothetical protein
MATNFSGGGSRSTRREPCTDHGQAIGKLDRMRLRVECTLFVIYKDTNVDSLVVFVFLNRFKTYWVFFFVKCIEKAF